MKEYQLEVNANTNKPSSRRGILELFYHGDNLSVSQIAEKMSLSRTFVSKVIADIEKNGLIRSVGKGDSTLKGGKKPELFVLDPNSRRTVAVRINPNDSEIQLLNILSQVSQRESILFADKDDYDRVLDET